MKNFCSIFMWRCDILIKGFFVKFYTKISLRKIKHIQKFFCPIGFGAGKKLIGL